MRKSLILLIAAASTLAGVTSASAYDGGVQRERAELRGDVVRLQRERAELRQAESRAQWDRASGHPVKAWLEEKQVRHEASDVRRAQADVSRDRAQLARDRR